ncbi:MAG TPA: MerR family transcriptional regulator [Alloacidobacterium sp.]|jgi:DNA-binding transcriptional MerR regulator|nr:MerR family transcriptional regulator [Alloacidobacterium sp.]
MQKQKHVSQRASQREGAGSTAIPDKLYFRIGEVARLCKVQAYVLRFWESEFPQLKPNKSGTGQRLYRKCDVEMALHVKRLLHEQGYTIAGARQLLQSEGREARKRNTAQPELPLKRQSTGSHADKNELRLQRLRMELKEILGMLSASPAPASRERKGKKAPLERPNLFSE